MSRESFHTLCGGDGAVGDERNERSRMTKVWASLAAFPGEFWRADVLVRLCLLKTAGEDARPPIFKLAADPAELSNHFADQTKVALYQSIAARNPV